MGVVRCQDGQGQLSLGQEWDGIGWDRAGGLGACGAWWGSEFGISVGGVGFLMLPEG